MVLRAMQDFQYPPYGILGFRIWMRVHIRGIGNYYYSILGFRLGYILGFIGHEVFKTFQGSPCPGVGEVRAQNECFSLGVGGLL